MSNSNNDDLDLEPECYPGQQVSEEAEQAAEMVTLLAERDEFKDRYLRLAAEFENYKKRMERDKAEFLRRATEGLVKELLSVLDNLERALTHSQEPAAQKSLMEGLELTHQDFLKLLTRHGLEYIRAEGQPFAPALHQAVMQQENDAAPENTVLRELQKGYLFQGRLLRPSMVVVSRGGATRQPEECRPESDSKAVEE